MHFVLPVLMSFSHSLFSLLVVSLARCLQCGHAEMEPPSSPLVAVCVQWFEQPSQGLWSSLHFQTSSPGTSPNTVISSRKEPCLSVYPTSNRTGGEMMVENLWYIQFHKSWQHHSFAVTIHLTDGEGGAQRR